MKLVTEPNLPFPAFRVFNLHKVKTKLYITHSIQKLAVNCGF